MRISDLNSDKALKNVILYLRASEEKELYDSIEILLNSKNYNNHMHVNDELFEHEITVALYDEQEMESLNERSKKIIFEDV